MMEETIKTDCYWKMFTIWFVLVIFAALLMLKQAHMHNVRTAAHTATIQYVPDSSWVKGGWE